MLLVISIEAFSLHSDANQDHRNMAGTALAVPLFSQDFRFTPLHKINDKISFYIQNLEQLSLFDNTAMLESVCIQM